MFYAVFFLLLLFRFLLRLIFVLISLVKVVSYFGTDKKDLPQTYLADMRVEGSMKKYPFKGGKAHRLDDLRAFEASFLRGELTPMLKSEDGKPSHERGPVQVLTGTSFSKRCGPEASTERDCLVMFYAPWCGHCKSLLPKVLSSSVV